MIGFIKMIVNTVASVMASVIGSFLALALLVYMTENTPTIKMKAKYYFGITKLKAKYGKEALKQKVSMAIAKVKCFRIRKLKIV